MSRRRTFSAHPRLYPAFVGGYLTEDQKTKLLALAQAGGWTIGQVLRVLVEAAELRPMRLKVHVSLPEPPPPGNA